MFNELYAGMTLTYKRLITRKDILEFAKISGDQGSHHIDLDHKLMAHGLLIATLPTKLGGDINYIARQMDFEFTRAVYEGETIACTGKIEKLVDQEKRYKAVFSFQCTNEDGEIVLEGSTKGMIWKQ